MQEEITFSPKYTTKQRFTRKITGSLVKGFLSGISKLGGLHPAANPKKYGIKVLKNIPYKDTGKQEHLLDIYLPEKAQRPLRTLFYIHGGGFRILSKDTHWLMGLAFARQGYAVFNINYRLAPQHPFPAAMQDASDALLWILENASNYEADPKELVLSGESAGGNLVTSVTLAAHYDTFSEPWAKQIWDAHPKIRAVIPACPMLQVSAPERYMQMQLLPTIVKSRILDISESYLPKHYDKPGAEPLADPLVFLEEGHAPKRPLPPFFTFVGDKDPIIDDTLRMQVALEQLGVTSEMKVYQGGVHAFHAFIWQQRAQQAWRDQFDFLKRHYPPINNT